MEFKGTKGKWKAKEINFRYAVGSKENGNINFIDCWRQGIGGIKTNEEAEANALLISKAPEMLEMLNHLSSSIDFSFDAWGSNQGIELFNKIEQLIKEATEL